MCEYPQKEFNHCYISTDGLYFLQKSFRNPNIEGNIHLLSTENAEPSYRELIINDIKPEASISREDLVHWVALMNVKKDSEYFVTANIFNPGKARTAENVHAITNIVISVGFHGEVDKGFDHRTVCLLDAILQESANGNQLPDPNEVVFTSDGLQLWWRFTPVLIDNGSGAIITARERLVKTWISTLKKLIESKPEFKNFTINEKESMDIAGFYCLPGTWNQKTGKMINHESLFPIAYSFSGICKKYCVM